MTRNMHHASLAFLDLGESNQSAQLCGSAGSKSVFNGGNVELRNGKRSRQIGLSMQTTLEFKRRPP